MFGSHSTEPVRLPRQVQVRTTIFLRSHDSNLALDSFAGITFPAVTLTLQDVPKVTLLIKPLLLVEPTSFLQVYDNANHDQQPQHVSGLLLTQVTSILHQLCD